MKNVIKSIFKVVLDNNLIDHDDSVLELLAKVWSSDKSLDGGFFIKKSVIKSEEFNLVRCEFVDEYESSSYKAMIMIEDDEYEKLVKIGLVKSSILDFEVLKIGQNLISEFLEVVGKI